MSTPLISSLSAPPLRISKLHPLISPLRISKLAQGGLDKLWKRRHWPVMQCRIEFEVRVRYGTAWYGSVVRCGVVRYGVVWYGKVWCSTVQYNTVRRGIVRRGMVWYGTVFSATRASGESRSDPLAPKSHKPKFGALVLRSAGSDPGETKVRPRNALLGPTEIYFQQQTAECSVPLCGTWCPFLLQRKSSPHPANQPSFQKSLHQSDVSALHFPGETHIDAHADAARLQAGVRGAGVGRRRRRRRVATGDGRPRRDAACHERIPSHKRYKTILF